MVNKDIAEKLFNDNFPLILWFFSHYNVDDEDLRQSIIVNAYEAILQYDESKGAISTYLVQVMKNHKYTVYNHAHMKRKIPEELISSLDAPVNYGTNEEHDLFYSDIIGAESIELEGVDNQSLLDYCTKQYIKYYPHNCDKNLALFVRHVNGAEYSEIAKQNNVSPQCIAVIINRIKKFYYDCAHNDLAKYKKCLNRYRYDLPKVKTKTLKLDGGILVHEFISGSSL